MSWGTCCPLLAARAASCLAAAASCCLRQQVAAAGRQLAPRAASSGQQVHQLTPPQPSLPHTSQAELESPDGIPIIAASVHTVDGEGDLEAPGKKKTWQAPAAFCCFS